MNVTRRGECKRLPPVFAEHLTSFDTNGLIQQSKNKAFSEKNRPKDAICKVNTTLLTSTVYYKYLCEAAEFTPSFLKI